MIERAAPEPRLGGTGGDIPGSDLHDGQHPSPMAALLKFPLSLQQAMPSDVQRDIHAGYGCLGSEEKCPEQIITCSSHKYGPDVYRVQTDDS